MVRRYRDEYAIAGIPLYTNSNEYNQYCLDCATDEIAACDSESIDTDRVRASEEKSIAE